ncbi:MAG TPA: ATP-binding protein, partial [Puia sp.]|nr:ATP-binding protein [Puia sp.]
LNDIISDIIFDFDLLITDKNAIIHYSELPTVEAIPLQIKQLFNNLISNALKFSKKDVPPVVTISSQIMPHEEQMKHTKLNQEIRYFNISVKDNGMGFDQKYADQIFLIFHRLHNRNEFSGTGIGLALCKKIVVNHNGEITGDSNGKDGAAFRILLPMTRHE